MAVDRRIFLKVTGAGIAGLAASSLLPSCVFPNYQGQVLLHQVAWHQNATDPKICASQTQQAVQYNFGFNFDWFTGQGERFLEGICQTPEFINGQIPFQVLFDTWINMFVNGFGSYENGYDFGNQDLKKCFIDCCTKIRDQFFHFPSYYKIDNRPVLFIYLAKFCNNLNQFEDAINTVRKELPGVHLQGDFVEGRRDYVNQPLTHEEKRRIRLFDSITLYNCYLPFTDQFDFDLGRYVNEYVIPSYLEWSILIDGLTTKIYGQDTGQKIKFYPNAIAHYDDYAIRGNPVLRGTPEQFENFLKFCTYFSGSIGPIYVTSMNEYTEGTALDGEHENLEKIAGVYGSQETSSSNLNFIGQKQLVDPRLRELIKERTIYDPYEEGDRDWELAYGHVDLSKTALSSVEDKELREFLYCNRRPI